MNIADIEKVANRRRINAEAEQLREKVTRETANIIKLKVAQDTAYWDLKEKLHQLENNHERLQQNMVEVQMQHESISGQYQDELRLRPETLNKLSSTREICDVLEEYTERLKATLSRCQADQTTLAEAYNKSGQVVRDIKCQQIQAEEKSQQLVQNLHEKIKLVTEHKEQMTQLFASAKLHLETELNDARAKLDTAMGQKDELFVALNDFSRKLDHFKRELEKKDENIAGLQVDMKKLVHEYNNEASEIKNRLLKKEKELKECSDTNESLKKALQNQDQYTKSTCEQNNQLQEKIFSLEEEQTAISNKLIEAEKKVEEVNFHCNQLIIQIDVLNKKNAELQKEVTEKIMLLEQSEIEHQNLKAENSTLQMEKSEIVANLEAVIQESKFKSDKNTELTSVTQNLEAKLAEMEIIMNNLKIENSNQISELQTALECKDKSIEVKDKELDCKATTINQLMSDLKNVTDAKTKLENILEKLKKDMEVDKDNMNEKEKAWTWKIDQLEILAKDKENELSKQMTIILDMRNEKAKLQEHIKGMQNTIDNIQKEVTGRITLPPREAAEQDDNAVMMTPPVLLQKEVVFEDALNLCFESHKNFEQLKQIGLHAHKNQHSSKMPPPQMQKKQQDLMYHLFSDNSMDNDITNDPEEINRRFDALTRGETISPLVLKRRKGPPVTLGGLKPLTDTSALPNSQATEGIKGKRTFFKSKRSDNKLKKFRPES